MNTQNLAQCLASGGTKKGTIITNIQLFLSLGVRFFWLLSPHIKLCIVSQCVIMEEEHDFIELVGDLSTG